MRKEDKGGGTMERLTNIGSNGEIWITDNDETRRLGRKESAYKKLAEYEDLDEQGLLLKLPCPIGTEVWTIMCGMTGKHPTLFKQSFEYSMIEHFGKAVFLTKDEAQNKMEEMSK